MSEHGLDVVDAPCGRQLLPERLVPTTTTKFHGALEAMVTVAKQGGGVEQLLSFALCLVPAITTKINTRRGTEFFHRI